MKIEKIFGKKAVASVVTTPIGMQWFHEFHGYTAELRRYIVAALGING